MTDIINTISEIVGSATGDGKGGEKQAENKPKSGFLDKFKHAFESASKEKDKGMWERVKIFASTLVKEFLGLGEEQKEVTKKTEGEVSKAIDAEMGKAKAAVNLDESASADDKAAFDEALAMGVASKASLDSEHGGNADRALAKIEATINGKTAEKLTFDEVSTMASMGLMTLAQLKDRYSDKAKFVEVVKKLYAVSAKSSLPLAKLLGADVLGLFKIDLEENKMAMGRVLEKFGMGMLFGGDFSPDDVKGAFDNLKAQPFANKEQTVSFFHKHIFTNTGESNVGEALTKLNEMIGDSADKLSVERLADFIFLIDAKDFTKLVTALVGPNNYLALKAAKV